MNDCLSNRIKSFSDVSGLYHGDAGVAGPYLNVESKLRGELFNREFENYSEISYDTSSDSSLKAKLQANQNSYMTDFVETNLMFGSSDGGTLSPLEAEVSRNLRWSDDEMSEILPLDRSFMQRNSLLDEEEELRYLHEAVHKAQYYDGCESDQAQDLFLNMPETQEADVDFFPSDSMMFNTLCEEEHLRWLILNESQNNLYRMLQQSLSDKHVVADTSQILRKSQDSQYHGFTQPQKADKKVVQPMPSPSISDSNKENEAKSSSPGKDGEKRIFLGGLPLDMTERSLREHLAKQGYKVLKRPKILRGFAPEVLMRSAQEAKELVDRGKITINGVEVEVRPFNKLMKQSESRKIPNIDKRTVFLGGLSDGTTARDILEAFKKMGMKVQNYPVIKLGYSRQVILDTVHHAKTLIAKQKVLINGTLVDIRPFVRKHGKKKSL